LGPPFNFAAVTTSPHLPFEDGYFNLICCGSVFTHIVDLADAWLLELKRIARPGAKLYVTVHDRHSADLIMNHPEKNDSLRNLLLSYDKKEYFSGRNFAMFTMFRGAESQVFMILIFYANIGDAF
jgi:ubiquinone/menaquinone biosynthesis C-methylase UbiE